MLTTTETLARSFNVTPFEIMAQDCDEVILYINFLLYKAENKPETPPTSARSEREESAAFWAAL